MKGGGAICAICYEDQVPGSDLLQSITSCGHVFHELCLQQWIEFCPNSRTPTCPLCKQNCGRGDVHRLFFQTSSSAAAESPRRDVPAPPTRASPDARAAQGGGDEESVPCLKHRLHVMAKVVKEAHAHILELENEALESRERVDKLKAEQVVGRKMEEGLRASLAGALDRLRASAALREAMAVEAAALTQELATRRLSTDVDMNEKEMHRVLAGNRGDGGGGGGSKDDKIEMVTKALYMRNREFKNLMRRCQELGSEEKRSEKRCVRLTDQMRLMKAKVQKMEAEAERGHNARRASSPPAPPRVRRHVTTVDPLARPPRNVGPLLSNLASRDELSAPVAGLLGIGEKQGGIDSRDAIFLDDDSDAEAPHGVVDDINRSGTRPEDMRNGAMSATNGQTDWLLRDEGGGPLDSGCNASPSVLSDGLIASDDFSADISRFLPSRQGVGLGLAAESFARGNSASRTDGPAFATSTIHPSNGSAEFIVSGADGRGGKMTVLKPPPAVVSVVGGRMLEGSSRPTKRVKCAAHSFGDRQSPALKIEHFFERV